jgi:hypothetical protein
MSSVCGCLSLDDSGFMGISASGTSKCLGPIRDAGVSNSPYNYPLSPADCKALHDLRNSTRTAGRKTAQRGEESVFWFQVPLMPLLWLEGISKCWRCL